MAKATLRADADALVTHQLPTLLQPQHDALVDGIVALVQDHTIVPLGPPQAGSPAVGRR